MTGVLRRIRRRPGRYPAAVIVLVLLIGLGATVVWATITRLVTRAWPPPVPAGIDWLATQPWSSPLLLTAAVIIGGLGLILVVLAAKPGGYAGAVLEQAPAPQVADAATVLSYRGLARLAVIHTRQLDGADDVRATVSSRRIRIQVRGPRTDHAELRRAVTDSVTARLTALKLRPMPKITVRSRHREVT